MLYELLPNTSKSREIKELYDKALQSYINSDKEDAQKVFSKLVQEYHDKPSLYFLNALEKGEEWGVKKMLSK